MTIRVEAIFENGVLRPIDSLPLYDQERVTLTIEPHDVKIDHECLAHYQAEAVKQVGNGTTVEEIRELLKNVPGSFSDLIIQERGDH